MRCLSAGEPMEEREDARVVGQPSPSKPVPELGELEDHPENTVSDRRHARILRSSTRRRPVPTNGGPSFGASVASVERRPVSTDRGAPDRSDPAPGIAGRSNFRPNNAPDAASAGCPAIRGSGQRPRWTGPVDVPHQLLLRGPAPGASASMVWKRSRPVRPPAAGSARCPALAEMRSTSMRQRATASTTAHPRGSERPRQPPVDGSRILLFGIRNSRPRTTQLHEVMRMHRRSPSLLRRTLLGSGCSDARYRKVLDETDAPRLPQIC